VFKNESFIDRHILQRQQTKSVIFLHSWYFTHYMLLTILIYKQFINNYIIIRLCYNGSHHVLLERYTTAVTLRELRPFARDIQAPDANYSCTLAFFRRCPDIRNGRGRFLQCPFPRT